MATLVLTDAFVSLGGNDVSDHVKEISIEYSADEVEDSNMGDSTHLFKGGLKNWTATLQLAQDYADGELDGILFPLIGTEVAFVGRPASGAKSVNNPEYTATGLLVNYAPLAGSVGELVTTPLTLRPASDLARAES